ncbi:MAG TPA: hypothetical protein VNL14_14895 [Candidatus Acidoferrales bacterium]|nr:hypothetical protein [Candidatus Acidoferrales bacterium]
MAALLALSFAGSVLAEEMKGKITKVGGGGREVTVKSKDGKEVTVKISGSRTKLEGVGDRSELKEGQSVTLEHDGGEAKKITVKAAK